MSPQSLRPGAHTGPVCSLAWFRAELSETEIVR